MQTVRIREWVRTKNYEFDVFLCHNSRDKPAVEEIARKLQDRNVRPWLDKWELRPGLPWQRAIEQHLQTVRAAAVFVGSDGFGPWQEMEQEALLRQFVERGCPVIPVILSEVQRVPTLPLFLSGMTWVDCRRSDINPIEQLVWGITGRNYEREAGDPGNQPMGKSLVPCQPIRDFTGRSSELRRLRSAIDSGHSIVGIRGLGGIGKTELALTLAKDLSDEYPDARLMVDLNGTSAEPFSWTEAMRQILQSLLPGDELPDTPKALAAAYVGQMSSRRGLLLLDNARDREQIEPLVPPDSWLLLVTSRLYFTLPGMFAYDLEVLERSEAHDLLLRISSRNLSEDAPAQEEILQLCGYLPLAVRLAGRALAERPDWSFAEYATRLKDRSERVEVLGEVMASIGLSHDLLGSEDRQRLAELSIVVGPFDEQSAAAIWNVGNAEADRILGRLLRYGLLQWDAAAGRYKLYNLVHDFAADSQGKETLESAHFRHARHLVSLMSELNALYLDGGEKMVQALADFDVNWPLIRSEFAWCVGCQNEKQALHLLNEFPDAAAQLLDLRRDPRERIEWRQVALEAARQLGDRRREANHLGNLGLAYAALGDTQSAIEYFQQRIAIARETGDRLLEGRGLGNLGVQFAEIGETQRAIECHEQYLSIAREIGDRRGQGNAFANLGLVYAQLNELSRSIDLHRQALAVSREIGDRRAEGEFLGNLGQAYSLQGDTGGAIECYEKTLQIDRELAIRDREADHCWFLGKALEQMDELPRAAQLIQASVQLKKELGHRDAEAHADYFARLESRLAESLRQRSSPAAKKSPEYLQTPPRESLNTTQERVPRVPEKSISRVVKAADGANIGTNFSHRSEIGWVGRQDALDQLAEALASVRQSRGATVLLCGESGIGKTALAQRFLEQACQQSETIVLCGKCYENVRRPFKGFDSLIDALANHLAGLPREAVERVMPVDVGSLCHVFSKLAEVKTFAQARTSTGTMDALEVRRRGFQSLRELLRRFARFNELVLFIDDLQWGGRDTAELFAQVFRSPDGPACLMMGAIRDENIDNEFLCAIRSHAEEDRDALSWQELKIERLSHDEASYLAATLLGDHATKALTQRIAVQAEGHPLLARLLSDYTLREVEQNRPLDEPPNLEAAVLSFLECAGQVSRHLLELLAVAGCALEEQLLIQAAGVEDSYAIDDLLAKQIVRVAEPTDVRRIDLYHDKFRATILASFSEDQLSAHSRRLALVLEAASGDPALLAELFIRSGEGEKAGNYFLHAATIAHHALAFHRASELYRLAIEQLQPSGEKEIQLRRSLGDSLSQSGNPVAAAEQYLMAAEVAKHPNRLDLLCLGARCLLTSGHVDPGVITLKRVLAECGIAYPHGSVAALASLLWHRLLLEWRGYELSVSEQGPSDIDLRRLQAYWAAVAGLSVIDPLRAANFAPRGLLHSLRCGDLTHVIRNLTAFSGHVAASGYRKRQQVDRLLDAIDDLAARDGQPYAQAAAAIARGVAAHLQSQYKSSVELCDQAVVCLLDDRSQSIDPRCCNATWELNVARSIAMWSLMYMGQLNELTRRQPELLRTAEETNNLLAALNFGTQIKTHIMLAADQPDEARSRLQADAKRLPAFGFFVQHQNHLLALAFLEQYGGNGVRAWQHLENARRRYTRSVLSRVQHMRIDFLQAKGRAALAAAAEADDPRQYLRAVETAADALAKQRTPWASAHAKLLRSARAAVDRDRLAAKSFAEAAEAFEACDGQLFAAAARIRAAQLNATGYEEAVANMSRLGVRDPERMSAALIPG